jgi:hypothetical protein
MQKMTIKRLIKILSCYENQNAEIILTIGNEDRDLFSTKHIECFSDTSADGYIELFASEHAIQQA